MFRSIGQRAAQQQGRSHYAVRQYQLRPSARSVDKILKAAKPGELLIAQTAAPALTEKFGTSALLECDRQQGVGS